MAAPRRARQRDFVTGILEHVTGCGKFLEPEGGLLGGIAQFDVTDENHEDFHARRPLPAGTNSGDESALAQMDHARGISVSNPRFSRLAAPISHKGTSLTNGSLRRGKQASLSINSTVIEY